MTKITLALFVAFVGIVGFGTAPASAWSYESCLAKRTPQMGPAQAAQFCARVRRNREIDAFNANYSKKKK